MWMMSETLDARLLLREMLHGSYGFGKLSTTCNDMNFTWRVCVYTHTKHTQTPLDGRDNGANVVDLLGQLTEFGNFTQAALGLLLPE